MQCAKAFQTCGHFKEAIALCNLHSPEDGKRSMDFDMVIMECLGELQNSKAILKLVSEVYTLHRGAKFYLMESLVINFGTGNNNLMTIEWCKDSKMWYL